MTAVRVHPRWPRWVGVVWLVAGAAMVLSTLVLIVDRHTLSWDVLLGPVALAIGWVHLTQTLVVDAHGIEQTVGWWRSRVVWDVVERVDIPAPGNGWRPAPVTVTLAGRGPVLLLAGWGLSGTQRIQLAGAVAAAAPSTITVEADLPAG